MRGRPAAVDSESRLSGQLEGKVQTVTVRDQFKVVEKLRLP